LRQIRCAVQDNERRGTEQHSLSSKELQRRVSGGPTF